jgi:hypothetical protein
MRYEVSLLWLQQLPVLDVLGKIHLKEKVAMSV